MSESRPTSAAPSAAAPSDDKPFALKYVEVMENLWVSTLERAVGDKRLLGLPLRMLDLNMAAQRKLQSLGSRWLSLWGVPTADQMRETMEMLQRVEALLQAQRAAAAAATVPAAATPAPESRP
jgi:hypothetical protein